MTPVHPGERVANYRAAISGIASPPKIGLIRDFFLERCDDEVRKNTEDVAQRLSKAGAIVEEVGLPESFATCYASHRIVMQVECAAFHQEFFQERADDYGPRLRSTIESGMLIPGVQYMQSQRMRRHFRQEMAALASGVDALLTPTTPAPAPRDLNTTG